MRTLKALGFFVMASWYYLSFLIVVVMVIGLGFDHENEQNQTIALVGGVGGLLNLMATLIWGLIAGNTLSRRGWNIGGKISSDFGNWVNLVATEGLFAFVTIALAAAHYEKTGKFFPRLEEEG